MRGASASSDFFAAPFAVDGELIGLGEWRLADLSPRWLEFSRGLLARGGQVFRTALPAPLDRIDLRFTSAGGSALAAFTAGGQPVASAAYLRGDDLGAEQELLDLFVESLRRATVVQQSWAGPEPFQAVFGLTQRPLHVVVAWGNPLVADEDEELVGELGNHLAGAFLCR